MPEGQPKDDDPEKYFGLVVLQEIQRRFPEIPVVILSSKPRELVSKRFAYLGALDFLARSDESGPDRLRELLWLHGLIEDPSGLIIGHSRSVLRALRDARRAAHDRRNVLIRGETGTGKELFARFIHENSPRKRNAELVSVNSGGLSSELYASELFGHVRGAFTGADRDREGRIVEADGDDVFLDEIGSMPFEVQAGVLRVIDLREVVPVGSSNAPRKVDVRFLFATNEDIELAAVAGTFRSDLLYRLREWGTLYLPALRDRLEDLPLLAEVFVRQAEEANPRAIRREIDQASLDKLAEWSWPGNVRELRSAIFSAVNEFFGIEHLAPNHFKLPQAPHGLPQKDQSAAVVVPAPNTVPPNVASVDDMLGFDFSAVEPNELIGRLPQCARWLARFLGAALKATAKSTLDQPEGDISITRAVRLITGDAGLKTSKAADIVKRLLQLDVNAVQEELKDPVLDEAFATACRIRPARREASGSEAKDGDKPKAAPGKESYA